MRSRFHGRSAGRSTGARCGAPEWRPMSLVTVLSHGPRRVAVCVPSPTLPALAWTMPTHPNGPWCMPRTRPWRYGGGSRPGGEGDGQVGERDREAEQGRCDLLSAVFRPAMGDQRADEQQRHPGRRGHAEGMPPQADHDACGGGEFGSPDEPVPGAGDPEVRGGRPHLGLAGQLAGRGEQAGRGQQQRDGDKHGNLLARLRLIPSSSPLTWSFPLAFTILSALTQGPAVTLADRRPAAPKFRFASEPAVAL